jgi:hypothetical protein
MSKLSLMRLLLTLLMAAAATTVSPAQTKPLYENDFEKAEVGKAPPEMLVLDGGFAVQQDGTNSCLELPGAPLESYGVLFGPTEQEGVAVTARVHGTGKGRRFPTFGVGLNGSGGYRLQVSPGKKLLELAKGDEVKSSLSFQWQSGQWTFLRLQVRKVHEGEWKVEGKAWTQSTPEPAEWMLSLTEKEAPRPGRAALYGSPFAGTPIRYDDLRLRPAGEK